MLAKPITRFVALLVIVLSVCSYLAHTTHAAADVPDPFESVQEDTNLPRVLILGDSISIGYTLPVREYLKGIANVQRANTNCGPTTKGLKLLDEWLGDKPWDVIHFNFGLHDLKYMDKEGKLVSDPAEGAHQVPLDQYEANLEKIVERLEKTNAVLIWRTTTPVPKGSAGRIQGDEVQYNEVALKVMKKHNITVHDLHAFCLPRIEQIQRRANVHFTPEGSKVLGEEVAKVIKEHLPHRDEAATKKKEK